MSNLSLDDFLPAYARTNEDGLPLQQKRKPDNAPRELAVVLFWNLYRCQCGAEYHGPQHMDSLYLKYEDRKHNCIRYKPLKSSTAFPSLDRLVDYKFHNLTACPFCTEIVDFDYSAGEIDEEPKPLKTTEEPTEDTSTEEVSSCGDMSLDTLLEAEDKSEEADTDEGGFTQNVRTH